MTASPAPRACPIVSLVTSHGRQRLDTSGDERLIDVLTRHNVPWSAVSVYVVPNGGGEPALRSCLDTVLTELLDVDEILLFFNRNINPFLFSVSGFRLVDDPDVTSAATEYFYQRFDNSRSISEVFLKKLSSDECKAIVADRIAEAIRETVPAGSSIVVGVSGGGDSNALLHGLSRIRDEVQVRALMLTGIPDWDKGVPRARQLCQDYEFDLTVLEEADIKSLLGMPDDSVPLVERFEREFKGDDFEFLGTLLIRLALTRQARRLGTSYICTGLNLEDILCEAMFRISSGLKPSSFPARTIGDMTLVFPLWLCPKRIIDGCFPKFSLENYEARYPCFSIGRNLYYSIVYAMQSQFPGFVEQLARGISSLSQRDPVAFIYDEELGFHVERFIPLALRQKFRRMTRSTGALPW